MAKKRTRTRYISKGERNNVSPALCAEVRATSSEALKALNLVRCWKAGKNPWILVENKQKGTNRPFYKVRANELWGNPKTAMSTIFNKNNPR